MHEIKGIIQLIEVALNFRFPNLNQRYVTNHYLVTNSGVPKILN